MSGKRSSIGTLAVYGEKILKTSVSWLKIVYLRDKIYVRGAFNKFPNFMVQELKIHYVIVIHLMR